jgi:hypothetical protein
MKLASLFGLRVACLLCLLACSSELPENRDGNRGNAGTVGVAGSGLTASGAAGQVSGNAGGATSSSGATGNAAGATGASTSGTNTGGAGVSGASSGDAAGASLGGAGAGGTSGGVNAGGGVSSDFFMRYEAESPLNILTYPVEGIATRAACPKDGVKEGADCASGGKNVNQILGRSPCTPPTSTTSYDQCENKGGGVQFKEITVPADGTYDVTWWYHCGPDKPGHADVYGDTKCGGLNYNTGAGSGCRPHLIDVNGVPMSSTVDGKPAPYYQFPCYPAPWSILHGATTELPLKAGSNTIYIHAPGATTLDAVDVDALDVQAAGRGRAAPPLWPKLVTPVVSAY